MENKSNITIEINSKSDFSFKNKDNKKKAINNSNISSLLQNPICIMNFLNQAEEKILLYNLNGSRNLSINYINILKNNNIKKEILENQIKYIQITDDFIDNRIKDEMDYNFGLDNYYKNVINRMIERTKKIPNNIQNNIPNNIIQPTNTHNKKVILNNKNNNKEILRRENPVKKGILDLSSFSDTIGGKKINTNPNRNNFMNNENEKNRPLKTFKIRKKEELTSLLPNVKFENESDKIIYNANINQIRPESPSSIQTTNTNSSKMSTNINDHILFSNNKLIKIDSNVIFRNKKKRDNSLNGRQLSQINDDSPLLPNECPTNNNRNKKKLLIKNEDTNKVINNNNYKNIIMNTDENINKIKNIKITSNLNPQVRKIKKINIKISKDEMPQRAKSPIHIKYNKDKDNSFILPIESFPMSDEKNKSFEKNNVYSINSFVKPKPNVKKDFVSDENNNNKSYIYQMRSKKKNIQLSPLSKIERGIFNINNKNDNRCILTENKTNVKQMKNEIINKSPTSIRNSPRINKGIIKKKLLNVHNNNNNGNKMINNNRNQNQPKKIEINNNVQNKNLNNKKINNNPNENKIFNINSENKIKNMNSIVNKDIIKNNNKIILNNNNIKENLQIKVKNTDVENNHKTKNSNVECKTNQKLSIKKNENIKDNNSNNNLKKNKNQKKKPKKKNIFNLDLFENDKDNSIDKSNNNEHSENISDISVSEDNKQQINSYKGMNEKNFINSNFDNNKRDNCNPIYVSFKPQEKNAQNNNNERNIGNDEEGIMTVESKLLKELKNKIKERNDKKKINNIIDNKKKNNRDDDNTVYKSNDLVRIIQAHKNEDKKNHFQNYNQIINNLEDNSNIQEKQSNNLIKNDNENNKIVINNVIKEENNYDENQLLSKNISTGNKKNFFENFSFKRHDTGYFGENNEERKTENNNNIINQSLNKNKNNNLNNNIEDNKNINNINKDINNNKEKKSLKILTFKINSELNESDFNDINFLE